MRYIKINLADILKEKDMSQKELAELTDIRAAAISEIVNNQRTTINKEHLNKIINALDISDISKLISIVND